MNGLPQWYNGYGSNPGGEMPGYLSSGLAGLGGADAGMEGIDPALQMRLIESQLGVNEATIANQNRQNLPLTGFAKGAQTFGNIAQGLSGLGQIYLGYQAMKQQKKAFKFNKSIANTNMNNSIMDYNRRLNDTLANRALNNGQGSGWVSEQLSKYSAKRS